MMRINFYDGNSLEVKGNKHFVNSVIGLLQPIVSAYTQVGAFNSEPHDQQRFEVEMKMAQEAQERGEPFTGKFVQCVVD